MNTTNLRRYIITGIFALALMTCLIPAQSAMAGDVPAGVIPQEVTATFTLSYTMGWSMAILGGKTVKSPQNPQAQEGDIVGIPVDMVYTCTFYNVGEMGGSQYAKATLTVTPIAKSGGIKYIMFKHPAKDEPYLITEDNTSLPAFEPEVLMQGTFSGGPDGTFKGTNAQGEEVTFAIIENGTKLTGFQKIPSTLTNSGMLTKYLMVQNPETVWKGWLEVDPGDSGMRFGGMTGQVEYCLPGADPEDPDSWRLCKMDTVLPVGATIRTQEDSSAIMSFGDLSTFVLKPEAAIVLTTPPAKESKIKMVAGTIWVNVKRMIKDGSMEIEMQEAVCGIKGTTFVCEEIDGKSTLKVIEGTVELTAKPDGKTVMVTAGNQVTTNQNGLGPMISFDTVSETADWDKVKNETAPLSGSSAVVIVLIVVIVVVIAVGAGVFVMKKKKRST